MTSIKMAYAKENAILFLALNTLVQKGDGIRSGTNKPLSNPALSRWFFYIFVKFILQTRNFFRNYKLTVIEMMLLRRKLFFYSQSGLRVFITFTILYLLPCHKQTVNIFVFQLLLIHFISMCFSVSESRCVIMPNCLNGHTDTNRNITNYPELYRTNRTRSIFFV